MYCATTSASYFCKFLKKILRNSQALILGLNLKNLKLTKFKMAGPEVKRSRSQVASVGLYVDMTA